MRTEHFHRYMPCENFGLHKENPLRDFNLLNKFCMFHIKMVVHLPYGIIKSIIDIMLAKEILDLDKKLSFNNAYKKRLM